MQAELIGYREAMEETGLPERTLKRRIAESNITVFIDGRDRRRRLIARHDVWKLVRIEPEVRGRKTA